MNVDWRHAPETERDIPPDPAFVDRRALLDPDVVRPALAQALPVVTGPLHLLNVYYYPGRTLQAVWRVGADVVTVEGVPAGHPAAAPAGLPVGTRPWVARVLPDDPALPTLAAGVAEAGVGAELFSYLPGRRAVLGDPTRVIKVSTPDGAVAAHQRQVALWSAPSRRFRMPRPVSVDAQRGLRVEQRVSGLPVESSLGRVAPERLARLVAEELAALHACAPQVDLARSGAAELVARVQHKTLRTLRRAVAPLSDQAERVVADLTARVPSPAGPLVMVHGDCHLANLVLDGDGLIFLDLDDVALGEPELDLAVFGSRLLLLALHRGHGLVESAQVVAALPSAYRSASGHDVPDEVFAWWLATTLIGRQVKTSIRHLAPGLGRLAATLLQLADDTLRQGRFDPALLAARAAPPRTRRSTSATGAVRSPSGVGPLLDGVG